MPSGVWTEQRVRDYFDTHWDVTLRKLSSMSGWSVKDLKAILLMG
jgi:hypothetical protein